MGYANLFRFSKNGSNDDNEMVRPKIMQQFLQNGHDVFVVRQGLYGW